MRMRSAIASLQALWCTDLALEACSSQSVKAYPPARADRRAATDRDIDVRQPFHGREGHAAAMGRTGAGAGRGFACSARPQHRAGRLRPWLDCKLLVVDRSYARHALPEALLRRH